MLAVVVTLGGCAGDDERDEAAPPSPPLTKAQLIKKGDAICRAGKARQRRADARAMKRWGDDPSREQVRTYVRDTVVPELRTQARQLRALVPPNRHAPAYDRMLDELEAVVAAVEKSPLDTISQDGDPFATANRIAAKLGFKVCSKP